MKINEIFYSLQGEGYWAGTPAVFVRFSGCNLSCSFCDTNHQDGEQYTEDMIVEEVMRYPAAHVIFTGGEPALQLTSSLVKRLHDLEKFLHMETNGSKELREGVAEYLDWITVSPKDAPLEIQRIDELKVLYHGAGQNPEIYNKVAVYHEEARYLQPCDVGDRNTNQRILNETIEYIKRNPHWKLSVQMHKLLGIR